MCSDDGSKRYYCNTSGTVVEKSCSDGKFCNIKGLNSTECTVPTVTTGGTPDVDKCVDGQYTATCINGGANALVCYNGTVKQWTCDQNQCALNPAMTSGISCAKAGTVITGGTPDTSKCSEDYIPTCINGGANALVCVKGVVKQQECLQNQCSVTNNVLNCPDPLTVTTGGTPDVDKCIDGQYTATCINGGANALVCYNGTVKQWTCADNQCTVQGSTADCPKTSGGGSTSGTTVTTGGTPDVDKCFRSQYQETCINGGANALVCTSGTVKQWTCADNQCSVTGNSVICPKPSSGGSSSDTSLINENIKPVPSTQNNAPGQSCDPDKFVEHCNGNSVVYCECDEENDDICKVTASSCGNDAACLTTLETDLWDDSTYNWAACYEKCTQENDIAKKCGLDEYWNFDLSDTLESYQCISTKTAGLISYFKDFDFCATPCANDTCTTNKTCNYATYVDKCSNGVAYVCNFGLDEDEFFIQAINCENFGAICVVDELGAYCNWE